MQEVGCPGADRLVRVLFKKLRCGIARQFSQEGDVRCLLQQLVEKRQMMNVMGGSAVLFAQDDHKRLVGVTLAVEFLPPRQDGVGACFCAVQDIRRFLLMGMNRPPHHLSQFRKHGYPAVPLYPQLP